MGHFWHFPAHVVVLVGLGLLLGQQGAQPVRTGWLAFAAAIVVGLGLAQLYAVRWNISMFLLIVAGVVGCLLALRLRLPVWLYLLLAAVAGVLLGLDSSPAMIPGMKALKMYAFMAGAVVADTLALLLLALLALGLRTLLDGVVLRVLGSWVAASALMVLTLMFAHR
ncbi:MAG: HupE/UreJ family protein [Candidatus Thiothrix singaporensis]|uniref:HupE/UreJ family protein n=1 Tax=Candidatus Thiothrix singaporensis TaxID=2799669 RepID=A0A7L6ARP6_9GAMM|nr:MAG: HupE/UreJ family protein [Candidatus Thiothrix singaporensis]